MKEYTFKEYDCGYCQFKWKQYVGITGGVEDALGRVAKKYSSQVQCPRCHNGCKTWDEGKTLEKIEIKGRLKERVEL
jgi:hypothetical protein